MKESTKKHKRFKKRRLRNNEYYDTQHTFDKLYHQSKKGYKFNNLMDIICSEKNILLAYRNIKKNTGSKTRGVDNITIGDFHIEDKDKFVEKINQKLNNFKPSKVRRVEIPKGDGRTRPLGIPTMEDRLIQQAIRQVLEPICEAKFHPQSYGFRPNRGTSHALAKAMSYINNNKLHYCVDIDIKGFFDNVNHGKLLKQMWSMGIRDKNLLCIISKILKSEIEGIGAPTKGTPQGGIISPLLSNIVLNELDWWIGSQWEQFETKHDYSFSRDGGKTIEQSNKYRALRKSSKLKEIYLVRYADDFKIFCRDYETAQKAYIATKEWLEERLGLEISKEKSKVTNLRKNKTTFLGLTLMAKPKKNKYVCQSNMSDKAKENAKKKLIKQIKVIQKQTNKAEVVKLNSMILGLHNYYKMASNCNLDFAEIDFHVRKVLSNRIGNNIKNKDCRTEAYKRLYRGYVGKLKTISDITLYPIHGIKNWAPLKFTQTINSYSEDGRRQIHEKLKGHHHLVEYLNSRGTKHIPIERFDNSISLIVAQKGLCGVTKTQLLSHEMELHHKTPLSKGGTDVYSNLIWINKNIHKLVHAIKPEVINKYIKFITDKTSLKKLNELRVLVGNPEISL